MTIPELVFRQAQFTDADAIADAHRDSIRSNGSAFYAPDDVEAWQSGLAGDVYVNAMKAGEVFFIATGILDGTRMVLGFASDYRIEGTTHGTSAYVRGAAARQGIGTALLRLAEEHALAAGAAIVQIDASLAGVEFYKANGYAETGVGEARLKSGYSLTCVMMRKDLRRRQ